MTVKFVYDEDKDIACLLKVGGGSTNSPGNRTKTYEALLEYTNDITNKEKVREFVRKFIAHNNIHCIEAAVELQTNWNMVGEEFQKRAEKIFRVSIAPDITAYLTITGRFPYNIEENYFYVSARKSNANSTAMHELMHFYTWEVFKQYLIDENISKELYNDIKESLTVLLNLEFADLLGREEDRGYPQHAEMRARISVLWNESKDINKVFESLLSTT